MTEDEAKTKWCPFAHRMTVIERPAGHAVALGSATRGMDHQAQSPCIASDCMAWRWDEAKRTLAFLEAVQAYMKTQPKPNFNTATQAVYAESGGRYERIEGGCGLAGAVQ